MRVTVTQFSDATPEIEWTRLVDYAAEHTPDLILLGEMPFDQWLPATDRVDRDAWNESVLKHYEFFGRLRDLAGAAVAASRPVGDSTPHNESFLWSQDQGHWGPHRKYYLPNEPGFWEASWYQRPAEKSFVAAPLGEAKCGFMICTEMWFTDHARSYARQGVDLLLIPRATEARTGAKWLAGGRAAAVMAGAFCLSSNRQGLSNGVMFGGDGWIIDPEGNVLATTTDQDPFVTLEIDLAASRAAKKSYPRYIPE